LQTPEHIHTPVGHACHASRGLVSSETLWFCLEPRSIQLPSTTSRRFPYLGHIGLTIWEAIIGEEGLHTRFPFSQQAVSQWRMWQAHTHCTHQYSYFGRLGLVNLRQITEQYMHIQLACYYLYSLLDSKHIYTQAHTCMYIWTIYMIVEFRTMISHQELIVKMFFLQKNCVFY
jgi:hypothetical protein